jgi:release factor glutamine methyltransferase
MADQPLNIVLSSIRNRLSPKYGDGESREMSRIIFENLKGWTPVDLAIRRDELVSDYICQKVDDVVERLLNDEPIQLIFGNAHFYGMTFKVTSDTLIPRPETAELVGLIVKDNQQKDLRILDAGTGTGCIAISLARNIPFSNVSAIDISENALAVAKENSKSLHTRVDFCHVDILTLPEGMPDAKFDIIVSNPPYIAESERRDMARNVLEFEPETALFVPDSDPLRFYNALLKAADSLLVAGGKIYFEINPLFAKELKANADELGFSDTTIIRDTDGKNRFFYAQKY